MRTLVLPLAAVLAALLCPSFALAAGAPSDRDSRVRIVDYDAAAVTAVTGVLRTATQIQFSDQETVLHVAVGDTDAWEVAVEDNVVFLKPRRLSAPTNLIVTTARAQGRRHYLFSLTAVARQPGGGVFALRFRYPSDQSAEGALALAEAALERRLIALKLERAVVVGERNLAYEVQGDEALQPSEVSDNARFTVLRFPGNQALPTLYRVTDNGEEQLVPFDVRGEFVVVHAVFKQLRLRSGAQVLCIYNRAFDPRGVNPGTGAAAPDVVRTDTGGRP